MNSRYAGRAAVLSRSMAGTRGAQRYERMILGVLLPGVVVLVCYGFALRLPFLFDDLPIMSWLDCHGWRDIWVRSESAYYRPLTFTVYKLGLLLPYGARQVFLHGANLLLHWANAALVAAVARRSGRDGREATVSAILFAAFPFMYMAIPWVTALGHPMVTGLTLLAVYGALRGEEEGRCCWRILSLAAIALAPFAHESGPITSFIVAGVLFIRHGVPFSLSRQGLVHTAVGVLLSSGGVIIRGFVPGVAGPRAVGLSTWLQNVTYFLQGLIYPLAPIAGALSRAHGWMDLPLVQIVACLFLGTLVALAVRTRGWRWFATGIWWYACAALPAVLALEFNYLYISPRHGLASVGIVWLWTSAIFGVADLLPSDWQRQLLAVLLTTAVLAQSMAFLRMQRDLFEELARVYRGVLDAIVGDAEEPLGFVNLPSALGYRQQVYPLTLANVVFIPWYSNVGEFIEVNVGWRASDAVVFTPVRHDMALAFSALGPGVDWEGIRRFALDSGSVWMATVREEHLVLEYAGALENRGALRAISVADRAVAIYGESVALVSATAKPALDGCWDLALEWLVYGPSQGDVFVHIRDADDAVVAQCDGPALAGTLPVWMWQSGDRVLDVRHLCVDHAYEEPYEVQVGLYSQDGRLPAYQGGFRVAQDAPVVALVGGTIGTPSLDLGGSEQK